MGKDSKKVIQDFIEYLNSDSIKYEFKNSGWSYDRTIYDFISYCYDNDIVLKYENIEEMSINDIRKYLYVIFNGERFSAGIIMNAIDNDKLKLVLKSYLKNYI